MSVSAGYFDGRTARRYAVVLSIEHGIACIEGEGITRQEPLGAVEIGTALGSAPRVLRFPDGASCEVTDVEGLRTLLAAAGIQLPAVSQWETSWRWAAGAIVVFLVVGLLAYRFAIPIIAQVVAFRVPAAASDVISRQALRLLDGRVLAPSALSTVRRDELTAAFRRLRIPAGSHSGFRLEFRSGRLLGPNALALPSGTIVLTDELVTFAGDDREILAVLAHEAGHVERRHGLRQMLQNSLVGLLVAWYIGDVSTIAAAAPTALIEAKYSRDLEREADSYAAAVLRDNGIDVQHLIEVLGRLDEQARAEGRAGGLQYLSSHPATSERLANLARQ